MKNRLAILSLAAATASHAAYTYYQTGDFLFNSNPYNPAANVWTKNGTLYTASAYGLQGSGSLISVPAVPGNPAYYEVKSLLKIGSTGGYKFVHYLRATSNAYLCGAGESFYSFEVENPTFNGTAFTASLNLYKCVSGSKTLISGRSVPWHDGMEMRSMVVPDSGTTRVQVFLDSQFQFNYTDPSPIASGQPGVGISGNPAYSGVQFAHLGPLDSVAPPAPDPNLFATLPDPTEIKFRWQTVADDQPNGVGVALYTFFRWNGSTWVWVGSSDTPEWTDPGLSPSTTYTYIIFASDFHNNFSSVQLAITTPASTARNPRQIGLRPTGAYWGAAGEQIDMRSGNLNFTVPVVRAQGRGGSGVGFALNYNSQQWTYHNGRTWKFGRDVGYGFGWRLLAGSITPVWSGAWALNHFIFTDSTGAEYKLDVNTGGVWTSRDATYVSYDSNANRLYFNNGSFWEMGAASGGTEQDAGTRYPTLAQDSNGNQTFIRYKTGVNASYAHSSSRVDEIEDVRAIACCNPQRYWTYQFTYNNDAVPHLTNVTTSLASAENYNFGVNFLSTLESPFDATTYGTTYVLSTITKVPENLVTTFDYTPSPKATGELTQVTFPYGGRLSWPYRDFTYVSGRKLREVSSRYLMKAPGAAWWFYGLVRDDAGDASKTFHSYTQVNDASNNGSRKYSFETNVASAYAGLPTQVDFLNSSNTVLRRETMAWTQDSQQRPYVWQADTILEPGASQKTSRSEQLLDSYGNISWRKAYDYNSLASPLKTYNFTYETAAAYTSRYLRGLLKTATVTGTGGTFNLVSNTFDSGTLTNRTGLREHDDANYGTAFTTRGNLTAQSKGGSTASLSYDITGELATATQGQATVTVTPSMNNTVPGTIVPNGNTLLQETLTYNNFLGLTQDSAPNGATASASFDAYARPQSTTSPSGQVTTYAYDNANRTVTATTGSRWAKTTMDGFGRTVKSEVGTGATTVSITETTYEPCACTPVGKVKQVSQPYAPGGTVYWTVYSYDALGRTVSVALPGGTGTSTYSYSVNTATSTDPAGKWKKFTMNGVGSLAQVNEPNPAGGLDFVTTYDYNALGALTTVTMPRNGTTQTRTFAFNADGQLTSSTNPENGTVTRAYDSYGRLDYTIDAKNQKTRYVYDSYNRVTTIYRHPAGSQTPDDQQTTTLEYDSDSGVGYGTSLQGRLASRKQMARDEFGQNMWFTDRFKYDAAGRVLGKRLDVTRYTGGAFKTGTLDSTYVYNLDSQLTSVTYPNGGPQYNFSYDALARPADMTQTNVGTLVSGLSYNAAGQITSMTYEGWTESRTYNVRNQLTRITVPGVFDEEYIFSGTQNNGRINQKKDWITGEVITYQYDSLQRLISASASGASVPWTQTYTYDGFTNLTGKSPASWSVNPANNRLGGGTVYDNNGNQAGPASEYNIANRLITWDGSERYAYTADGKRIWKQNGSTLEVTFYGIGGQRMATYSVAAGASSLTFTEVARNVWFGGKLIRTGSPSAQKSVIADRLASVRVRKQGATTENLDFYPYGDEKPSSTAQNNEKFATYYRDATGLDYADQRQFNSGFGRFTSPDPIGDGTNWYAYASGDPANSSDPSGLAGCRFYSQQAEDTLGVCPPGWLWESTGPTLSVIATPGQQLAPGVAWAEFFLNRSANLSDGDQIHGCVAMFGNPSNVSPPVYPGQWLPLLLSPSPGSSDLPWAWSEWEDLGITVGPDKVDINQATVRPVPVVLSGTNGGPDVLVTGAVLVLNSNPLSVWNQGPLFDPYGIGNADPSHMKYIYQAITLIHELGHVYAVSEGPGGHKLLGDTSIVTPDAGKSYVNQNMVFNNCVADYYGLPKVPENKKP
ncbi:MAG: RHS repeat-associated core domain-containing protein [Bryobacteraceae bacterium]